jgi:hypothetical protein
MWLWCNASGKGKVHPRTGQEGPEGGVEVELYPFFNLGARWGGRSTPRPARFNPGKDPVTIVLQTGWAPGPVWTGEENPPTGYDPRTVQPVASHYTV